MAERLCIDPYTVKRSNGKATCASPKFDKARENGCVGCSKLIYGNRELRSGMTLAEKNAHIVIQDLRNSRYKSYY